MSGYPDRISRLDLGPNYINTKPVKKPTMQIDGRTVKNLSLWQLAGMNRVVPRAIVEFTTLAAGVIDTQNTYRSWDPNDELDEAVIVRIPSGRYTIVFPESSFVPNQAGVARRSSLKAIWSFITSSNTTLRAYGLTISALSYEVRINDLTPLPFDPPVGSRITSVFY